MFYCCFSSRDTDSYDPDSLTCSPLYVFVDIDQQEDDGLLQRNNGDLYPIHAVQGHNQVIPCRPYTPSTHVSLKSHTTGRSFNESGHSYSYDPTEGFFIKNMYWTDEWYELTCTAVSIENITDGIEVKIFWSVETAEDVKEAQTWFEPAKSATNFTEGDNISIECRARNQVGVHSWIEWMFNHDTKTMKELTSLYTDRISIVNEKLVIMDILQDELISKLTINNSRPDDSGVYSCRLVSRGNKVFPAVDKVIQVYANPVDKSSDLTSTTVIDSSSPSSLVFNPVNFVSGDKEKITEELVPLSFSSWILHPFLLVPVVFITSFAFLLFFLLYLRQKRKYDSFSSVYRSAKISLRRWCPNRLEISEQSSPRHHLDKKWIIDPSQIQFHENGSVGTGNFGCVNRAWMQSLGRDVAVKRIKKESYDSQDSKESLYRELCILSTLGVHKNVVGLIGVVFYPELMLIEEYCRLGNLSQFLQRKSRDQEFYEIPKNEFGQIIQRCLTPNSNYSRPIDSYPLTNQDLMSYSIQVSEGLSFLSSKNIIHRDVAARNVLLMTRTQVKICDFGLSKNCNHYQEVSYKTRNSRPMPFKWMSPESLGHPQVFSEKSDVWSFGIFLFEVFSLGKTPFEGINEPIDVLNLIKHPNWYEEWFRGWLKESQLPIGVWMIMTRCWDPCPNERPSFSQLQKDLKEIQVIFNPVDQETSVLAVV